VALYTLHAEHAKAIGYIYHITRLQVFTGCFQHTCMQFSHGAP
jgi:hypothetical protein